MKKFVTFFCTILCVSFTSIGHSQIIKGTYAIKNMQTGLLLRLKDADAANGTPLVAYHPVNWKCMTWNFQHIEGNTYQLKNLFTDKTFQPKASITEGVALEEQPLVAKKTLQQFEFIPVERNIYNIRLKGTELYLTPVDTKGSDNSAIVLASKKNSKYQLWTIYEQNPEY